MDKKHKLVYIEWEDACSNESWMNEDEISRWANGRKYIVKQVGFIYKEDKEHIILFTGLQEEYELTMHQFMKIPKSLIRKRINLTKYIK